MFLRVKKQTRYVFIVVILVIALATLHTLSPVTLSGSSKQTLYLNLKVLYDKLTTSAVDLDDNKAFDTKLQHILAEKFDDDSAQIFYFLKPEYVPPTSVSVPDHFTVSKKEHGRPAVQPFDPRFTISVYLEWIRKNPGKSVPFHWSDWVDLSMLNKYILLKHGKKETCKSLFTLDKDTAQGSTLLPIEEYCKDDPNFRLGFRVTKFPKAQERENARLLAKAHLYSSFPAPARIFFLTNSKGSYTIKVTERNNDLKNSLLNNNMVEEVISADNIEKLDVLESYRSLLKSRLPDSIPPPDRLKIELEESWFEVDPDTMINRLKKSIKTDMDEAYLDSLLFSRDTKAPEKSFNEAKFLQNDNRRIFGDHHDWRFFNGLTIDTDKQVIALHRLLKNYLHFCRMNGLITWIAHGSLLSWYWNGMVFPWDADTDVQMPIRDLHRLGREFNQTLVIENIGHDYAGSRVKDIDFNGMGAFFIDVGSSITHREKGNGLNNIDARFIDIQTGLYVDITGLSVSNERAPGRYGSLGKGKNAEINRAKKLYNCRNRHFASLEELSPLVKTVVQNEAGYVPQSFGPILDHEYALKGMLKTNFQQFFYLTSMRLWVRSNLLLSYVKDKSSWVAQQRGESKSSKRDMNSNELQSVSEFEVDDYVNLLYNNWLLREYIVGRDFTKFHEDQMTYLLSHRMEKYFSEIEEYSAKPELNKAMWGDLFMDEIAIHGWSYEDEVNKLNALVDIYKAEEDKEAKAKAEKEAKEKANKGTKGKAEKEAKEKSNKESKGKAGKKVKENAERAANGNSEKAAGKKTAAQQKEGKEANNQDDDKDNAELDELLGLD